MRLRAGVVRGSRAEPPPACGHGHAGGGLRASCARLARGGMRPCVFERTRGALGRLWRPAHDANGPRRLAPRGPRTTRRAVLRPVPVRARRHRRHRFCRRQRTASTPQARRRHRPPTAAGARLRKGTGGGRQIKAGAIFRVPDVRKQDFRRWKTRFKAFYGLFQKDPSRARAGGLFALQGASGSLETALFPFGATWCGVPSAARPRP